MKVYRRPVRSGFTLVELLVVILIIAILSAMLLTGLTVAQRRARNFAISAEIAGLENSLDSFKGDLGDYPPDFEEFDLNRVPGGGVNFGKTHASRFIRKNFPRISGGDLTQISARAPTIDNAEVLVLWLRGLSKDPQRPFTGPGGPLNTSDRRQPRFDFDANRLADRDLDGFFEYYPPGRDIELSVPYSYFNSNGYSFTYIDPSSNTLEYGYAEHRTASLWRFDDTQTPPYVQVVQPNMGVSRPLRSTAGILLTNQDPNDMHVAKGFYFMNREKFQIICGGLDGLYGQGVGFFPTGAPWPTATTGYLLDDQDNLTNFSENKTLKQAIP